MSSTSARRSDGRGPTPEELSSSDADDPRAQWYATEHETAAQLLELYQRVRVFTDESIDREQIDGSTGLLRDASNVPESVDWPAYVAELEAIGERSSGPLHTG